MFAEKLKDARINAGLTQKQLGELIGKDKFIISKFENGYCLPNLQDLEKICEILHITAKKLGYQQVATTPKQVATSHKAKTRPNTYKLTATLNRDDFKELTKSNLKKCGCKNLADFIKLGYEELLKKLQEA